MEIVSENNTENFFQFEFRDGGNYFTSGHSIHNGFKIFSLFQNKRDVVHALSGIEHEAIFPFARMDEDKYFFVKYYYDENGDEIQDSRRIMAWRDNKLVEYENITGLFSYGVVLENKLYYTVYNQSKDVFDLYYLDVNNFNSKGILVEKDLESGQIYLYNNKLNKSDNHMIYSDDDEYKKMDLNYFDDNEDIIIQIQEIGVEIPALFVIDARTKEVIGKADDVIDFKVQDGKIIVYCHGHIDIIER